MSSQERSEYFELNMTIYVLAQSCIIKTQARCGVMLKTNRSLEVLLSEIWIVLSMYMCKYLLATKMNANIPPIADFLN